MKKILIILCAFSAPLFCESLNLDILYDAATIFKESQDLKIQGKIVKAEKMEDKAHSIVYNHLKKGKQYTLPNGCLINSKKWELIEEQPNSCQKSEILNFGIIDFKNNTIKEKWEDCENGCKITFVVRSKEEEAINLVPGLCKLSKGSMQRCERMRKRMCDYSEIYNKIELWITITKVENIKK